MLYRLNPVYDQAMNNLANILKDQGKLSEAEELLFSAIKIRYFLFSLKFLGYEILKVCNFGFLLFPILFQQLIFFSLQHFKYFLPFEISLWYLELV